MFDNLTLVGHFFILLVSFLHAAHGCCEEVSVTLCAVTHGEPEASDEPATLPSHVAALAEHHFTFVQDLAFDMAQFLVSLEPTPPHFQIEDRKNVFSFVRFTNQVSTVGRTDGLDGALLLDECHIPLRECERLDESLALALHHIPLPPGWNLLGNQSSGSVGKTCNPVNYPKTPPPEFIFFPL